MIRWLKLVLRTRCGVTFSTRRVNANASGCDWRLPDEIKVATVAEFRGATNFHCLTAAKIDDPL